MHLLIRAAHEGESVVHEWVDELTNRADFLSMQIAVPVLHVTGPLSGMIFDSSSPSIAS
jgi:hypothetical protein